MRTAAAECMQLLSTTNDQASNIANYIAQAATSSAHDDDATQAWDQASNALADNMQMHRCLVQSMRTCITKAGSASSSNGL